MTPARTTSGLSAGESGRDRLICLGTLLQVRAKNRVESAFRVHFAVFQADLEQVGGLWLLVSDPVSRCN